MWLSNWANRSTAVVFMLLILLMGFGVFSYFTLPAQEDPKITIREAVVTTAYPGLSAEKVELLITKTLEEAIREIEQIKEIRSMSMTGVSIIHAELMFSDDYELDQVWDDMRKRLDDKLNELPLGTQPPRINDDFGDVAVVTAALTSDDFAMAEKFDMAQHIRDILYTVDGTKRVDILGAQSERIFIETSNARLAALGLSPEVVIGVLQQQNIIRPGGEIDTGERTFIVEPTGNFDSVNAVKNTLIRLPGGGDIIALSDLAEVRRDYIDPPLQKAYFNGDAALVFSIAMLDGYRVLDYAERVRNRLDALESTLPHGYDLDIITFQADQVADSVYGVTKNVLQTLAIVLAVVILFLGWRTGLIVGSIVPTVMLITLAIMGFFDMPLERMSLATLIIALGLLVDNGIVIAEDFKRRLENGESRDDALSNGTRELSLPLLSSTATTILVFLPLMLADHGSGEYTRSISLVILISLSVSWLLAMTVTPILCHRFIKIQENEENDSRQDIFDRVNGGYEKILRMILHVRAIFLTAMVVFLVLAFFGLGKIPNKFFPDSDRAQVLVYIDLPADVSSRLTDRSLLDIAKVLEDRDRFPHIESHASYVGFGGPRFVLSLTPIDPAPNRAFMVINVDSASAVAPTVEALRDMFNRQFSGLAARVSPMFLGPSDSSKIEIQVKGPDHDYIFSMSKKIESLLRDMPGAIDVRSDWDNRIAKVLVDIDQFQARRAGVTSADIADALQGYFSGTVVTEFREGDEVFPIVARATASERSRLDRLKTLTVYSNDGRTAVPLSQVANIRLSSAYSRIARENLIPTITTEARSTTVSAEDMVPKLTPALDDLRKSLAPGHNIEFDGVVGESAEGQEALAANVPLCIAAILVLLVAQFNSIRRPAIIVATIPLLLIGAVIGLLVLQAYFGFMVILGLYALAGIIINNAVVLIDKIDIERAKADEDKQFDALVSASVARLRPIVMTTLTTILGLMPLIISQDPLFYGMSGAIAFGLLVGSVLTLGVVPVLYSLLFSINTKKTAETSASAKQNEPEASGA